MGIEHVVHTPSPALKGLCPAAQISWDKPIYDLHFNTERLNLAWQHVGEFVGISSPRLKRVMPQCKFPEPLHTSGTS